MAHRGKDHSGKNKQDKGRATEKRNHRMGAQINAPWIGANQKGSRANRGHTHP